MQGLCARVAHGKPAGERAPAAGTLPEPRAATGVPGAQRGL